jgi:hypothetical protein
LDGSSRPVVLFRNIFDGERDHAVMRFNADMSPGPVSRVSEDHWKIDACPHHGPSLAIGPDGTYHAVWFSGGGVRQGSFYARSTDKGRTFSEPMRIGERQAARPYLATLNGMVWMAWKAFDGEKTSVFVSSSRDAGVTWSPPRAMVSATDYSDHPLLISDGRKVYLSWLARNEGYRVVPVEGER